MAGGRTVAETLRDLRKGIGKTLVEVSEETGIAFSLISRYERGELTPQAPNLFKLADYYHRHPRDIITMVEAARQQAQNGRVSLCPRSSFPLASLRPSSGVGGGCACLRRPACTSSSPSPWR